MSLRQGVGRRRLILTAVGLSALVACDATRREEPTEKEKTMDAHDMLTAAGLSVPEAELTMKNLEPIGDQQWRGVVVFSGESALIENWVDENFASGIQSTAYKDDMATYAEFLGEGVQKEGDRITEGAHESVQYVVIVGQETQPVVHVGVARS